MIRNVLVPYYLAITFVYFLFYFTYRESVLFEVVGVLAMITMPFVAIPIAYVLKWFSERTYKEDEK